METTKRQPRTPLIEELLQNPFDFEFHQAVKIFEAASPDLLPLGDDSNLDRQPITLKSRALLSYPSSDISLIQKSEDEASPLEMHVNFFGLGGSQGPLPMPHTETLIGRIAQKDFVMRDFLDIFNHRLLSILHKIKKKHNIALSPTDPHQTPHARILSHLVGLSKPALRNRFPISDDHFYGLGAFIWQKHRSTVGLTAFLEDFFKIPVSIDQFKGTWKDVDPEEITYIGKRPFGRNNTLGRTAALGTRFWDQQGLVQINLGPLSYKTFCSFLKTEKNYTLFCEVVRFYLQLTHTFQINLILKKEDVPACRLGEGRLAWTSWMKTKPFPEDDRQVMLSGDVN